MIAGTSTQSPITPAPGEPVLVTGGCGFIGHHLVRRLVDLGHSVTVYDDLSTGDPSRLPAGGDLRFIEGSVLDKSALSEAAAGCRWIYHLASVVGMMRAMENPAYTFRVSEEGTQNVFEQSGDAAVVLFSSSAIYGLDLRGDAREDEERPWEPVLAYDGGRPGYACGKWAMEKVGREAAASGRQVLILRPFNVVGDQQSGAYGMVLPRFFEQARQGRPLTVYDDGAQRRCFSHVGTFVDTVLRLIALEESWRPENLVLNVGSAESTAISDLASLVLEATGSASAIENRPYTEVFPGKFDVRDRIPDLPRLTSLLGEVRWPSMAEIVGELAQAEATTAAPLPARSL